MSLASATSSRVDSASKHIQPCKVNTDYMLSTVEGVVEDPRKELEQNKHKYSMAKDDMVVGLGRPRFQPSLLTNRKRAYPSVITNLGRMDSIAKNFLCLYHSTQNPDMGTKLMNIMTFALEKTADQINALPMSAEVTSVVSDIVAMASKNDKPIDDTIAKTQLAKVSTTLGIASGSDDGKGRRIVSQIKDSLEFYFVGIALGLAYAHPNSGDTVASVMIGGLRTIQNGPFPVHTNDQLMFAIPGEPTLFESETGKRVNRGVYGDIVSMGSFCKSGTLSATGAYTGPDKSAKQHKDYYNRGNGNYPGGAPMKINTFMVIPYLPSRHTDADGNIQEFPHDAKRVWGRAISNAQPYEMMDVQLGRQAI